MNVAMSANFEQFLEKITFAIEYTNEEQTATDAEPFLAMIRANQDLLAARLAEARDAARISRVSVPVSLDGIETRPDMAAADPVSRTLQPRRRRGRVMSPLPAVPSPAQIPAARQNARLHLQSKALNGIKNHLLGGGTDTEFMLRLTRNALSETATGSDGHFAAELRRHAHGLEALRRHLTVGGTDRRSSSAWPSTRSPGTARDRQGSRGSGRPQSCRTGGRMSGNAQYMQADGSPR
jgi:hypothetical protein